MTYETETAARYVAGWNRPGYLPDGDVYECDSIEDARLALADDMRRWADDMDDDDAAEELRAAADMLEWQTQPCEILAAGFAWWIAPADDTE